MIPSKTHSPIYKAVHYAIYGVPAGGAPAAPWTPAQWFLASEQGIWLDPSDFTRYMSELGPELIADPEFNNAGNWTTTPSWTVSGGVATHNGSAADYIYTATEAPVVGKWYLLTVTAPTVIGLISVYCGLTPAALNITTPGTHKIAVQCQGTGLKFSLRCSNASGGNTVVTAFSAKELTAINTATMFQDSAGTTPVTAVEQPVGLVLDKRLGLTYGAQKTLVSNNASVVYTGGIATFTAAATSHGVAEAASGTLTLGRWYEISFRVVSISSGSIRAYAGNGGVGVTAVASGTYTCRVPATASTVGSIVAIGSTTAVVDSISYRELSGNHASQATTAQKPVLSARKNLALSTNALHTYTTLLSPIVTANAALAPDGTMTATQIEVGAGQTAFSLRNVGPNTLVGNNSNSIYFKLVGGTTGELAVMRSDRATSYCGVNVATRAPLVANGAGITNSAVTIDTLPDGWYRYNGAYTSDTATENRILLQNSVAGAKILLWGVQVEQGNLSTSSTYQRVNTATDYDTVGFPHYLKFDGVDDNLVTGNIDFTATDKMTVVAGVRKLSDAATAIFCELSVNVNSSPGSFWVLAPNNGSTINSIHRGSILPASGAQNTGLAAPISVVIAASGDIAGDMQTLRTNGGTATPITLDLGTGNYGNYPLYIGRRGGTSLPFNGHLYSLTVRGAATDAAGVTAGETYTAGKTGITL